VTDEKENRTMEVLVTTISPSQLVSGKILGIVAISMTMLLSWMGVIILGVFVCRQAGINWFSDLSMDWRSVLATLIIALPSYILATALMTAIGAAVTTTREGQSVSSIFVILHLLPFYSAILFLKDPNSTLAVLMSVFPFTSLMAVGIRNLFTIVPAWQVVISVLVQTACAAGAIWLAARTFNLGMLRYGQRLNIHHLLKLKGKGA
jgi:ABC-2 type transport system permease protein